MNLKDMTVEELEARMAAIKADLDKDDADLDALEADARGINEELEARKAQEAQKAEIRSQVAEGAGEVKQTLEEEERKTEMYGIETPEYRSAFINNLLGKATVEERAILADNTNYAQITELTIELYTDNKDFAAEAAVEDALTAAEIVYEKDETYIDSERMYMVTYSTEVLINGQS